MNRRRFLQVSGASAVLALHPKDIAVPAEAIEASPAKRGWLVYTGARLGTRGEALSRRVVSAMATSPLLAALSAGQPVRAFDAGATPIQMTEQLAYNHVLLIAPGDDALLLQAWQREAIVTPHAMHAFGFGAFQGSLGYIESDRNPFLHAANITKNPFETQLITITGTDSDGIELAVEALLSQGLVNGLVGKQGKWSRASKTLLDRDPLPLPFTLPVVLPATFAGMGRIAVIQASEDEYRGVLADTGLEPAWIWRAKYYKAGLWDAGGEVASFYNYSVGLHRRAYGNTVWAAGFGSESNAALAARAIAKAARLVPVGSRWQGSLPPYAWGLPDTDAPQTGSLGLWVDGECVLMSSESALVFRS